MRSRLAFLAAVLALVLTACSRAGAASPSAAPATPATTVAASTAADVELIVFGAASLKGVLDKAEAAYEMAYPGTNVTVSADSSSTLEMQIEHGAPADVFLSADPTNPKKLADDGRRVVATKLADPKVKYALIAVGARGRYHLGREPVR